MRLVSAITLLKVFDATSGDFDAEVSTINADPCIGQLWLFLIIAVNILREVVSRSLHVRLLVVDLNT